MMPTILLKLLPYLAAIGLAFGGYFYVHHNGFVEGQHATQEKWDKATAEAVRAQLAAHQANQEKINNLEVTRNENLKYIEKLDADNRALVKRLRLPLTTCPRILPPVAPPGGSQDPVAASGVVPTSSETGSGEVAGDMAQRAFDIYEQSRDSEAYRCDKLIEDVRPVLIWADSLNL